MISQAADESSSFQVAVKMFPAEDCVIKMEQQLRITTAGLSCVVQELGPELHHTLESTVRKGL